MNYAFNLLLAKLLGATQFGEFSYCLNLYNIVTLLSLFALDQALLRFIPQRQKTASAYISFALKFVLIASISLSGIFYVGSQMLLDENLARLTRLFALLVIPASTLTIGIATLQGKHILLPRLGLKYGLEPISKFAFLLLLIPFGLNAESPIYAALFASMLSNITLFFLFRRLFSRKSTSLGESTSAKDEISKFIKPLALSNIINIVSARLDFLLLGVFVSAHQLGLYAISLQTSAILAIVLQGIEMIYTSRFSQYIGENDKQKLNNDYQDSLRLSLLIGLPVALVFLVNGKDLLSLFGEEFNEAYPVLVALTISQLVNLGTGSANSLLIMSGHTRLVLINSLLFALLISISVYLGIQTLGFWGAAIAIALSNITINIIRVAQAYILLRATPYTRYIYKLAFAFCSSYGLSILINQESLLIATLLSPALFFLCVVLLGLDQKDKAAISHIVRRAKLL